MNDRTVSDAGPARTASPEVNTGDAASMAAALRYWEWRRIVYNAVLAGVVLVVFAWHAPIVLERASIDGGLALFLLAVLANVAYCAAYPVDLVVQRARWPAATRRVRTVLFVVGLAFAAVLAQFVTRGMLAEG
jgi:hypothetical protein